MQFHNDRSMPMPGSSERGKLTLPWSLLLLGSGYFLLVAGPLLTSRFTGLRWVRELASGHAWVPAPAAAGAALLGAAALIFVVARLVRDVEQRPYASIAPVLAVFSGFVLTSTRTELPLPGFGSAQLGILVLALGLLGGVLIGRQGWSERVLGWTLAVVPSLALLAALTATLGQADPVSMLRSVDPAQRTYLMLLSVSSLCLGLVGAVARHLVRSEVKLDEVPQNLSQSGSFAEPGLRLPRPSRPSQPGVRPQAPQPLHTATLMGGAAIARHNPQALAVRAMPMQHVGPTSYDYAQPVQFRNHQATPRMGELAIDDPDLLALTGSKFQVGRLLTSLIVLAASALVGTYFFVVRPRQHDADLARVRSAALHPVPPAASADDDTSSANKRLLEAAKRALLEDTAAGAVASDLPRSNVPTVTPLAPSASEALVVPTPTSMPEQAVSPVEPDKVSQHAHRSRARARHRHVAESRSSKSVEAAAVDEPEAAPVARTARVEKPVKVEKTAQKLQAPVVAAPKPAAAAKPATAKPTQNEADLDLDQLVHKALKSSNGVDAQEDPILGL